MNNAKENREFKTEGEVRQLVKRFEDGSLPRSEWDHRAHLTMALWYLMHYDEGQASSAVIAGIQRYNRANGIRRTRNSGYHETLTLFWLAVAHAFLQGCRPGVSKLEQVNDFVAMYSPHRDLFLDYYSRERIFSWQARYYWVEPDLKPLDFVQEEGKRSSSL